MKIASGFYLKEIMGENIVVPVGSQSIRFQGMITLNSSGVFLWKQLMSDKTQDELLNSMLEEYEIDPETAKADIKNFLTVLKEREILE